jgi:hypothetical protein
MVMPRTPDRVARDDAFAEGAAIVRALAADGENFVAQTDEQDRFLSDVTADHAAIGQ